MGLEPHLARAPYLFRVSIFRRSKTSRPYSAHRDDPYCRTSPRNLNEWCIFICSSVRYRGISVMSIHAIHKALASPLRRSILAWLKDPSHHFNEEYMPFSNGVSAGQIHERCGVSKSTVSAHLAILQGAGLVTSHRVGQWIFFKRNESVVKTFIEEISQTL